MLRCWRSCELESGIGIGRRGGGFDRNVRDMKELKKEIAYIHDNPVRRGLVEKSVDWKWSSARWYAGQTEGEIEIDPIGKWDRPRVR